MATALEVAARAFRASERSGSSLVGLAEATASPGPEDRLVGVILAHGSQDHCTDEGLRQALGEYFDRSSEE